MIHLSNSRSVNAAAREAADISRMPQIDGWQLVRQLSGSASTTVYSARPAGTHPSQPASYAIKLLTADANYADSALELLCREARAARKISNSHVAPVLAASLHQPPYFLVMPFLSGASLGDLLAAGSRPVLPVALWIVRQAAEGLDALHQAGWRHGDIKPANIMIAPSGHATLIDLGFAERLDEETNRWSRDQIVAGTLSNLAPELLISTMRADIRSDIYSLGVMLFEMLAGRLPFDAKDAAKLALEHREELPEDLRVLAPQLPTRAARLVRFMLAKDPLRRPQTPGELVDRLAALEIETFADRAA